MLFEELHDLKSINQSLLSIKKLHLSELDKNTLIDWELIKLGEVDEIALEVWLDDNNAIKILAQGDTICAEEISRLLDRKVISHIERLVKETLCVQSN